MVLMKGLAITAGSRWIFSASRGSRQPTVLAQITVKIMVRQMTMATGTVSPGVWKTCMSRARSLTKLQAARVTPQITATRISFQTTSKRSVNSTSPRDRPRMTATEAWVPLLPPVPVSMGMKAVSTVQAARELSYPVRTMLVRVAESMRMSSQGTRLFQVSRTPVRR